MLINVLNWRKNIFQIVSSKNFLSVLQVVRMTSTFRINVAQNICSVCDEQIQRSADEMLMFLTVDSPNERGKKKLRRGKISTMS